jgi:hypothetical protein
MMDAGIAYAQCARRVYPRMPGDPRRPQAQSDHVIDVLSGLFIASLATFAPIMGLRNRRYLGVNQGNRLGPRWRIER